MPNNLLWYSEQQIGETRHMTPEGYLVCENVPIARLGPMLYARGEIPVTADSAGLITVTRDDEEVFRQETLASFNGKPVVIRHPPELVSSKTWKTHAVGHAMNVRRGTGDKASHMVADLLITTEDGIDAIVNKKITQISNGYQADYETIRPGLGRQYNIRGNHIALVENARCGETCAVGDSNDRVIELQGKGIKGMPTVAEQLTRAMEAWRTKDSATLDQVMGEMAGGSSGPPGRPGDTLPNPADQSGSQQHRIIVNVHGGQAATPGTATGTPTPGMGGPAVQPVVTGAGGPGAGGAVQPGAASADPAIATLQQQVAQILALLQGDDDNDDTDGDDGSSMPNEGGNKPAASTGDAAAATAAAAATTDSASLAPFFQDVLARAEILAPGGANMPTFDAKAPETQTNDSLCGVMRKALTTGYANDQTRVIMQPLLAGKAADFDKLTCDSVTSFFMAASELKKMTNNQKTAAPTIDVAHSTNKPPNQKEINDKNASFWKS